MCYHLFTLKLGRYRPCNKHVNRENNGCLSPHSMCMMTRNYRNTRVVCKCKDGYIGDPAKRCTGKQESDPERSESISGDRRHANSQWMTFTYFSKNPDNIYIAITYCYSKKLSFTIATDFRLPPQNTNSMNVKERIRRF